MSKDQAVPDPAPTFSAKFPLRTYSRHGRAIKRSLSSVTEYLSRSDDLAKPDNKSARLRLAEPDLSLRRRRRTDPPLQRTITDIFWEHLGSPEPALSQPQEANCAEPSIATKVKQDADGASAGAKPHSFGVGDVVAATQEEQETKTPLCQLAHGTPLEVVAPKNDKQHGKHSEESGNDEYIPQLGLLNKTTFKPSLKARFMRGNRRGTPLSFPSPTLPKMKTRHLLDVDESLSVVEASPASARPFSATLTAQHKDSDPQEFRKLKFRKETRVKHSTDGFEGDEARPGYSGKKRRIDSSELSIGPLELTKKCVATRRVEGPTWSRGQKKHRVAVTTSPWSQRNYFGASRFQIDSEDVIEAIQVKQSKTAVKATQNRTKRRISHILSDDDEALVLLPVTHEGTTEHDTRLDSNAKIPRTSPAKYDEYCPYTSDADESVDLLVFPVGDEDHTTLPAIPRTSAPEHDAEVEDGAYGQLPPKRWILNVLNDDEDELALRPGSKEWTVSVTMQDATPRK